VREWCQCHEPLRLSLLSSRFVYMKYYSKYTQPPPLALLAAMVSLVIARQSDVHLLGGPNGESYVGKQAGRRQWYYLRPVNWKHEIS
jgi:hypothetical protein